MDYFSSCEIHKVQFITLFSGKSHKISIHISNKKEVFSYQPDGDGVLSRRERVFFSPLEMLKYA